MARGVVIEQEARKFALAGGTDITTAGFPSRIPQIARPTADATHHVIDLCGADTGNVIPKQAILQFVGAGVNDNTVSIRLLSWRRIKGAGFGQGTAPQNDLYIPTILWELATIIGAATGVAGSPVDNTHLFVDTLTLPPTSQAAVSGTDGANNTTLGSLIVYSPTNDLVAWVQTELFGSELIEIIYNNTAGTPAMNTLYALL